MCTLSGKQVILSVIISEAIFCVKRQESLMKAGYGKFGGQ